MFYNFNSLDSPWFGGMNDIKFVIFHAVPNTIMIRVEVPYTMLNPQKYLHNYRRWKRKSNVLVWRKLKKNCLRFKNINALIFFICFKFISTGLFRHLLKTLNMVKFKCVNHRQSCTQRLKCVFSAQISEYKLFYFILKTTFSISDCLFDIFKMELWKFLQQIFHQAYFDTCWLSVIFRFTGPFNDRLLAEFN